MSVFVAPLDADVHRDFEIQYGTTNITQLRNILRCNLLKVSAENNLHAALAGNGEVVVFENERSFNEYKMNYNGVQNQFNV